MIEGAIAYTWRLAILSNTSATLEFTAFVENDLCSRLLKEPVMSNRRKLCLCLNQE